MVDLYSLKRLIKTLFLTLSVLQQKLFYEAFYFRITDLISM